ncbi:nuclease-related domain-containing protein [Neobacillus sp. K501]
MFLKDLVIPEQLLKAEALERRIIPQHESMPSLKSMIKSLRSGYNGEKTIQYYLSQIPPQKYQILHDIRLPLAYTFFQIDAILLSPKSILFLDGKNHSGTLHIQKDQMIQEYLGSREVYENPFSQAERHKIQLRYWLDQYHFPQIRIEYLVVITKSHTEVKISTDYPEARAKICKVHDLLRKIEEMETIKIAPHKQSIEKIGSLLLKDHTPLKKDILQMFHIKQSDIFSGVHCPNCLFLPMIYHRKMDMPIV